MMDIITLRTKMQELTMQYIQENGMAPPPAEYWHILDGALDMLIDLESAEYGGTHGTDEKTLGGPLYDPDKQGAKVVRRNKA